MSEPIEIEVPGPAARGRVTVEQIASYLKRTGWEDDTDDTIDNQGWRFFTGWKADLELPTSRADCDVPRCLGLVIEKIAWKERRATHLVLADIAAEQVDNCSQDGE